MLLIGVAVAEGGLVATTADLLGGLQRIVMVGPGGKLEPASVVAEDKTSDVALVSVPEDLPVPPFADDTTLASGMRRHGAHLRARRQGARSRCTAPPAR